MIYSLLAALGSAACFGVASVLQKLGVREAGVERRFSPGVLVVFARQRLFVLGVVLDAVGFALNLVALQRLPFFVVQSVIASAVAVTAVLSWRLLGEALSRVERGAVATIVVGLTMVAATAAPEAGGPLPGAGRALLLAGVPLLASAAVLADRAFAGRARALTLSGLAGLAFAGFDIAGRLLPQPHTLAGLVTNPLAWAVPGFAGLGVALFGTALQRGSTTSVTTLAMIVETLVPTAIGFLLSEHARPGFAGVAVLGFALSFAAAVVLASSAPTGSGDPAEPEPEPELEPEPALLAR